MPLRNLRAVFFAYHAVQQHQRPQLNRHAPNACPRYLRRQDTQNIYEGFLLFPLFLFLLFHPFNHHHSQPPRASSVLCGAPSPAVFSGFGRLSNFQIPIFVRLAPIPLTSVWEPLFPSPAPWILCCALKATRGMLAHTLHAIPTLVLCYRDGDAE